MKLTLISDYRGPQESMIPMANGVLEHVKQSTLIGLQWAEFSPSFIKSVEGWLEFIASLPRPVFHGMSTTQEYLIADKGRSYLWVLSY